MVVQNPNWPVLDYAVAFGSGPLATQVPNFWASVGERTEGRVSVKRGKQYELDQTQPGELTMTLRNDDGLFDPSNSASPFWPLVRPYTLMRLRAQWPPTVNLLTGDQATASFSSFGAVTTSTLPQWVTAPGTLAASIAPLSGSSNKYVLAAGSPSVGAAQLTFTGFSVAAGLSYAAQFAFTCASSVSLAVGIDWINAAGSVISSSVGSTVVGTAGTCTTVGTAPAAAVGARFSVITQASPVAAAVSVSAVQIEKNTATTAFVVPSTWYPIFTGLVERWPQQWSSGGNYGVSNLTAVDLFAWWANRGLSYAAYLEVLSLSPTWFYPLDESAGATSFRDLTNNRQPAAILTQSGPSPQTLTPGGSLQSTGGYLPLGVDGPVVSFSVSNSSQATKVIDLTGSGVNKAGPPTPGAWTRMIAFRVPKTPGITSSTGILWDCLAQTTGANELQVQLGYDGSGSGVVSNLQITLYQGNAIAAQLQPNPANLVLSDGGWHLLMFGVSGTTFSGWLDGVALVPTVNLPAPLTPDFTGGTDQIGGSYGPHATGGETWVVGDVSCAAEFPVLLSSGQVQNLYEAFRYAWGSQSPTHSETSDGRYARLLAWAGYVGATLLSAGSSTAYGPAVDIQGGSSPTALLAALQAVVDSEGGQHFIARDGTPIFRSRANRYNLAPVVTFGELVASGEVPYLSAGTDFDPTRIANDVTTTAEFGGTTGAAATSYRVVDANSAAMYGDITLGRTINTIDPGELLGAAQELLYQNSQPLQRLEEIAVDVASNPALWTALLPRELGDAVTVNRRPANAPLITVPGFLEQIQWLFDDKGSAVFSAQVSNALLHHFAQFDSAAYGLFDSTLIFGY